jgi:MSHA biogenesis protein MshG
VPSFSYKGRSGRGEPVTGRLDAESVDAVAARLMNLGVTPVAIEPVSAAEDALNVLWRRMGGGRPTNADLMLFSRQMYTIVKAGVPLLKGLRGLAHSTHNAVLRETLEDIVQSLESGRDLTASFARHPHIFPHLYTSIMRVGESTGTLEQSFARLCEYLGQAQDIAERVRGALRYPLIVVGAVALALVVLATFVIPSFAPLFKVLGDDIPWPTRVVMGVSDFMQQHWGLLLAGMIAAALGIRAHLRTDSGRYRWHRAMLRLPSVGRLIHQAVLARIARSLAISLNAGLPLIQTLAVIARSSGNDFMAEKVLAVRDAVERGDSLSQAIAGVGMFPPLVVQMVSVGEETGELNELLVEVAGFYEREVDHQLRNLSEIIQPVMIVCVGAMVLVLALGVFLPIWDMVAKVGSMR